jgi:predicted nucleotidyltransferase
MSSTTQKLMEKGLALGAPPFLKTNIHYETIMGSHAYGVADTSVRDKIPDYDVYGWAIPPKNMIFRHLDGHIPGFGPEPPSFDQYQKHHMMDQDALGGNGKEWDLQIFNIVKFFELCRENNPNIIDSLFTPENCVLHITQIGRMVRDSRKIFLSKECWKKFRGYAQSQLKKMNDKEPVGKRKEIVDKHGYDIKFAYHIIRLLDEAEQIMLEGDLDLQRAREVMKAIRRGEWTAEEVREFAMKKEIALEAAYSVCKLPEHPPIEPIKQLLMNCLEAHYGSLEGCVSQAGWAEGALKQIDTLLDTVRKQLYSA